MIDYSSANITNLFFKLFFPTLLGMFSVSAVTTIDGIFVGHGVGSHGIAAINLCVPLIMLLTGFGLMVGVGGSVIASISLGKGKIIYTRGTMTQALIFAVFISSIVTLILIFFPQWVGMILGTSTTLMPFVTDYLIYFAPSLIFELIIAISVFALRLDGAPNFAMLSSIVTAATNAVLDYIFIFPLNMGIKGAAIATSLSCFIGALMVLYYLAFKAQKIKLISLHLSLQGFIFFAKNIRSQCIIGSSAFLGETTLAVLMFVGNYTFMHYLGDNGVGAFGICCYYLPFVFMTGNSIAQSSQPIISYNFSITTKKRVKKALNISLKTAFCCSSIMALFFILFPEIMVNIFVNLSDPSAQIAIHGFPYIGIGFIFFVLNLAVIGYLQSIEDVKRSTLIALMRGFIFLIPSFILLPQLTGEKGIWLALTFSELTVTLIILINVLRLRFIKIHHITHQNN